MPLTSVFPSESSDLKSSFTGISATPVTPTDIVFASLVELILVPSVVNAVTSKELICQH
jgi:hypothetical protein